MIEWKNVRKSGTVIFVMMIIPNLVSLISALVVSRLGTVPLAGVSLGVAIFAVVGAVPAAFATAQQIIVSRFDGLGSAWGALPGTVEVLKKSLLVSLLMTCGCIIACLIGVQFNVSQEFRLALLYLAGRIGSVVPLLVTALFGTLVFVGGGRKFYLESIFFNALLSIPLCAVLTLGLGGFKGFGVFGDGLGATLAGLASVGFLLFRSRGIVLVNYRARFDELRNLYDRQFEGQGFANWRRFVAPLVASNAFDYLCTLSLVFISSIFGSAFVAAFRVGQNLQLIYFAVVASVVMGVVIEANSRVSGGPPKIFAASRAYLRRVSPMVLLVGVLCVLGGGAVFYALAEDSRFREALWLILAITAVAVIPCSWAYTWVGQLRILGGTELELRTNLFALVFFQIPPALVLGWLFGGPGVFCGFVTYWIGRGLLSRSAAIRMHDRIYARSSI